MALTDEQRARVDAYLAPKLEKFAAHKALKRKDITEPIEIIMFLVSHIKALEAENKTLKDILQNFLAIASYLGAKSQDTEDELNDLIGRAEKALKGNQETP